MPINDEDELSFSVSVNNRVRIEPGAGACIVFQSEIGRSPNLHSALVDSRYVGVANNGPGADAP
jgi:hypothetical protein